MIDDLLPSKDPFFFVPYHPTRSAAGQGRRTSFPTLFVVAVVN